MDWRYARGFHSVDERNLLRATQKGVQRGHSFSFKSSDFSRHWKGMACSSWSAARIWSLWLSLAQLSPRDVPSSSASCTSGITVGPTREDGRPTLLEEAGALNKKMEAWGSARDVPKSTFTGRHSFRGSLRATKCLPGFLEVVCIWKRARCQRTSLQAHE